MGKRSAFERKPRDFYPTPESALLPLIPHLPNKFDFWEPCAGDGALIDHIISSKPLSTCILATDIEPQADGIHKQDALECSLGDVAHINITNPPWDRKILHPMIEHFCNDAPTWLLFDADWMHTKQSAYYMKWCVKIVSVGRVKWIPDSKMTGKDNCAWYLFDMWSSDASHPKFYGRTQ